MMGCGCANEMIGKVLATCGLGSDDGGVSSAGVGLPLSNQEIVLRYSVRSVRVGRYVLKRRV